MVVKKLKKTVCFQGTTSLLELITVDGWMDDLRFYVLFNSVSVISGRWTDDNERLCAMGPRLRLKRSLPQAEIESRTVGSRGQRLTH